MEMMLGSRRISYIDQGFGAPVLLLHGWGAPAALYRLIIDQLSAQYRVIAPDLPGFGGSDEPDTAWCVDDYVDFALDFVRALGIDRATLIGHSFGGRMIIKLLNRKNSGFTADRVILIDAAGIRPKRTLGYHVRVRSYKLAKWFLGTKLVRSLYPDALKDLQKNAGSSDYRNASPIMRQTMVRCINEDLTDLLGGVYPPTLLIWGENDTDTPLSDGQLMEKKIPDAGLVVLSGAGHFSFSEQWGVCSRVLDSFMATPI